MLAAFERFIKEVGPQDTVYIHYSGHGSQVADLNGNEADDHLSEWTASTVTILLE